MKRSLLALAFLALCALPAAAAVTTASGTLTVFSPYSPTDAGVNAYGPVEVLNGTAQADPKPYLFLFKLSTDMRCSIASYDAAGVYAGDIFHDYSATVTPTFMVNILTGLAAGGTESGNTYTVSTGPAGVDIYGRTVFGWTLTTNAANGSFPNFFDPPFRRGR